jgi:hypothetical protein
VYGEPTSPQKDSKKHSKFLGATVASQRDDAFERKIQYLKDMGFLDEKKNAQILKGLNGNVDKAVETLIRLGEGTNHNENLRNQLPTPRATPVNGITVEKNRMSTAQAPPVQSNNPFDRPDTNKSLPPPPSSPTDRSVSPPQAAAYNPSGQPVQQFSQPQTSIDQAFSNMSINQQPAQPQGAAPQLFPNTTGGYGGQNQAAFNPFMQQTAAPPVPQIPQQYSQFTPPTSTNPPQQAFQPQPQSQPQPQPQTQYSNPVAPNPFLRTSRSQNFNPSNPFDTQGPFNAYSTAPQYGNLQPQIQQSASPFGVQPQQTAAQHTVQTSQSNSYNPFQASNPGSQSVFGGGFSASPAGTPYGQPGGQTNGNSYPFTQQAATSPGVGQTFGASSPFGPSQGATSPFGQPTGASPFVPQPTGASPFGQATNTSPFGPPGPVQQQPGFQQSPPDMQQFQAPQAPFAQQQSSFQSPSSAPPQQPSMFQAPTPHQIAQPTGMGFGPRHDKTSILALYNMPQLAPQSQSSFQHNGINGGQTVVQDFATQQPHVPQRSVTMPVNPTVASPPNPFALLAAKPPNAAQNSSAFAAGLSGPSRESVDFAGLAMMNGRHSPDAFSGLSARLR